MTASQALVARMSETEKIRIRGVVGQDAITALYHRYRNELTGGPVRGGTVEDGVREMNEVVSEVHAQFDANSSNESFARTWLF